MLFESSTLHASANNLSHRPRHSLFFGYNSVINAPLAPFCGNRPRPGLVATREDFSPLRRLDDVATPVTRDRSHRACVTASC